MMSTPETATGSAAASAPPAPGELRLEVVQVPVSDVDRAKEFYAGLGWREDADLAFGEDIRVVQFTPPGSGCSIAISKGLTKMEPGSVERLEMAVYDIDAARDELISRGVEVSELVHRGESGLEPGPDPDRASYNTYASFSDPDGNSWLLQEIKERLPGR
jgi:catechol 2,3-dioxygenase-like lactoylglutathione lyase family enzyme